MTLLSPAPRDPLDITGDIEVTWHTDEPSETVASFFVQHACSSEGQRLQRVLVMVGGSQHQRAHLVGLVEGKLDHHAA